MQKTKKRIIQISLIASLICLSAILVPPKNPDVSAQKEMKKAIPRKYTIAEKKKILFDLGVDLKTNYGLKISPSKFADMALIMLYCESGLNPKAVSVDGHESQGISQLTSATRKRLNIPDCILDDDFPRQVEYFKQFLISTKKISKIDNSITLHLLNFAPCVPLSRQDSICTATGGLVHLDLNKNGKIDSRDFLQFQRQRTSENKTVKAIFEKHYGQP